MGPSKKSSKMKEKITINPYPIKRGTSLVELPKGSKIVGAGKRMCWHPVPSVDGSSLCIYVMHSIEVCDKEYRCVVTTEIDKEKKVTVSKDLLRLVAGEGGFRQQAEDDLVLVGPPNDKLRKVRLQ